METFSVFFFPPLTAIDVHRRRLDIDRFFKEKHVRVVRFFIFEAVFEAKTGPRQAQGLDGF